MENKIPYFVSWSGGKDSCLALHRTIKKYGKPQLLFNVLTEDNFRSRSHGIKKNILEKQAESLGIPIHFAAASWNDYESEFLKALHSFRNLDIQLGVFGDVKIPNNPVWNSHRKWADEICQKSKIISEQPLWNDHAKILDEFFSEGYLAKIIAVKSELLSQDYLGQTLTPKLISEFIAKGIDPCGEQGEYHTFVIDGPIFKEKLEFKENFSVLRDGYWFLDFESH